MNSDSHTSIDEDRPLEDGEPTLQRDLDATTAQAIGTLFDIGRIWAVHGLGVGRSALRASAITLRSTAELLGDLGELLEEDGSAVREPEPSA